MYHFTIDTEAKLVLFEAEGKFDADELFSCVREVVEDPRFEPGMGHLVDFTGASEMQFDAQAMRARVDFDRTLLGRVGQARVALIANEDALFGMLRMYQLLMDDADVEVRTFRDRVEGRQWLVDALTASD